MKNLDAKSGGISRSFLDSRRANERCTTISSLSWPTLETLRRIEIHGISPSDANRPTKLEFVATTNPNESKQVEALPRLQDKVIAYTGTELRSPHSNYGYCCLAQSAFGPYDKRVSMRSARLGKSDTFFISSPYRYHIGPFECLAGWVVVNHQACCRQRFRF